jgi:hypothetical protein
MNTSTQTERLYNVIRVNDKTGEKHSFGFHPTPHDKACVLLTKVSDTPVNCRDMLEEVGAPVPLTVKEATKLVRARHKYKKELNGRQIPGLNMPAVERERLGVAYHLLCSQLGVVDLDTDTVFGAVYHIQTTGGNYRTHYDVYDGTIFGRFENPEGVKGKLFPDPNPCSGKWNAHTSSDDNADETIKEWEAQLRKVLA